MSKSITESTVARIAGNLLSGNQSVPYIADKDVQATVALARKICVEVERTCQEKLSVDVSTNVS